MEIIQFINHNPILLFLLITWDLVLKGIALWKSGRNDQKYWFIALLVVNSVGILPLIYLIVLKYRRSKD